MRYTACQPRLFPPLYIVERMARCPRYIVMEEAQFDRGCVSVVLADKEREHGYGPALHNPSRKLFTEVKLADGRFCGRLARAAQMAYGRFEHYKALKPWFEEVLDEVERNALLGMCWESTAAVIKMLDLDCTMKSSLAIVPQRPQNPSEWIAQLGAGVGCDEYLGGEAGYRYYMEPELLQRRGIRPMVQAYKGTMHSQRSILDALFRYGKEAVLTEIKAEKGHDRVNMREWP